ncbi:hypothetical protein F8568_021285 [Actinomadura sp. LD22]|uniref:Uncharacterized protein n=1 Tax=Actinomadura physcomitrii TaxID=2650748 RepID=A0A6I4MGL1_9ACTN|nr:hypothetical protein [Actinomadura physcomitrii]MWA02861.1 hypothetical protein [Actinomadura physcomitrii]
MACAGTSAGRAGAQAASSWTAASVALPATGTSTTSRCRASPTGTKCSNANVTVPRAGCRRFFAPCARTPTSPASHSARNDALPSRSSPIRSARAASAGYRARVTRNCPAVTAAASSWST